MPDSRQERVNKLREAYEGYFAMFRQFGAHAANPATLDHVVGDNEKRSEVALKMALAELVRPV